MVNSVIRVRQDTSVADGKGWNTSMTGGKEITGAFIVNDESGKGIAIGRDGGSWSDARVD